MNSLEQALSPGQQDQFRSSTDLTGFLSIIRRHLLSIAAVTLAAVAAVIFLLTITPPVYTATSTLFIDPRARKIVTDDVVQGGLATDAALVESQVQIITSETVLRRAVDALGLDKDPSIVPPPSTGLLAKIKTAIRGPRPEIEPRIAALEALYRAIKVKRATKTYVVDIEVDWTDAARASAIANAVAEAYLADQLATKAEEARRANELIDARLGELGEQVRVAETRVDEFKKANRIVTSEGGIVTEQQLGKLNAELASARAVAAEAKARYDQASSMARGKIAPDNVPDAIKSGLIQKLRDQYAQLARREAALSTQLQPRHPMLIDVRSQLAEITSQIQDELKRIAEASRAESEIAESREKDLLATIEKSKEEVARTGTASIKLHELEREAAASRELLQAFLARAKETQEQQNVATSEARIVSPAITPSRPSKPSRILLLTLGFIGGLGLGIAQALARHHFDGTVRTEADLARAASLKQLGHLPRVKPCSIFERIQRLFSGAPSSFGGRSYGDLLVAIGDTRGRAAPAYRQAVLRLLGRLRAGAREGEALALMIAGPHRGAGASAVALSLGYAAALGGDRVLVVDATSSDPALSGVFGKSLGNGLAIKLDSKEQLAGIVAQDDRSGLHLLPIALADIRTLRGDQRRRLVAGLTALTQDYDLVVYDAGPLLIDESPLSLLPLIDRIALVTSTGETKREELAHVTELLEPARDRIAGAVLNDSIDG